MAGRGPTTFQKRQKEQQRKEKRLNKLARREERRQNPQAGDTEGDSETLDPNESIDTDETDVEALVD